MAYVKLKEALGGCPAGDVVKVPATVARKLLFQNKAVGGKISLKNVKTLQNQPVKEKPKPKEAPKKETIHPDNEYPKRKGKSNWYELSNGESVNGEQNAIEAQAEL